MFALNDDKSGWNEHIAEYVILIGLADVLFTDHHYRVHDGVDPNTTSQVRYLLYSLFSETSSPKVHFTVSRTLLVL